MPKKATLMLVMIILQSLSCKSQEKKTYNNYFDTMKDSAIDFFSAFDEQKPRQNNKVRIFFDFTRPIEGRESIPFFNYDAMDKMQAVIDVVPKPNYKSDWLKIRKKISWSNQRDSIQLVFTKKADSMLENFAYIAFAFTGKDIIGTGECMADEYEAKGCRDVYEICDTCDLIYHIYILEKNNKWLKLGDFKAAPKYKYNPNTKDYYNQVRLVRYLVGTRIVEGKSFDDIVMLIK